MGFLNSFWRQKKCRQTELTEVQFDVQVSPLAAAGLDKAFVESVEKLADGEFLVTLKERAQHLLHPTFLNVKNGVGMVSAVDNQSITIETQTLAAVTAVAAQKDIQDLNFEADTAGAAGNAITISYVTGGTAGAEAVNVTGTDIEVEIEEGVSTAAQIKTAIEADVGAAALVDITLLGAGTEAQDLQSVTALEGGADAYSAGDNYDLDFSIGLVWLYTGFIR
jgi:hypothetical protein